MSWLKLKNLIQSMDKRRKGSKKGETFEKFVVQLLKLLLEIPFVPARTGSQPSGDARSLTGEISVQAKNYSNSKDLRIESIVRDIHRARNKLQDIEVYVLAVSCDTAQLHDGGVKLNTRSSVKNHKTSIPDLLRLLIDFGTDGEIPKRRNVILKFSKEDFANIAAERKFQHSPHELPLVETIFRLRQPTIHNTF